MKKYDVIYQAIQALCAACFSYVSAVLEPLFLFLDALLKGMRPRSVWVFVRPCVVKPATGLQLWHRLTLLFAAEDEGRTFDPTERKIQKAREEGRVAKTQELPTALVLLVVIALLGGFGKHMASALMEVFEYYFGAMHSVRSFGHVDHLLFIGMQIGRIVVPVFIAAFVMAVLGTVLQIGWAPSAKSITPNFSRVSFNLNKWFEKMLSTQGWYTLSFMFVRLLVVSVIVVLNATMSFDDISASISHSFIEGIALSARLIFFVFLQSALALLALSFVDLQFQTYLFREQLKMTRQEIKDELKESEGDAEVKRHIQNRMKEFITRNVKENIKKADVLITNPTHFAVALQYDTATMLAPLVVAKGEDAMAFHMRRLAKDFEVPIIENKPLARALHAELEVGEEIPERYYRAVVLIFEQIYKMKGMGVYE